MNKTNIQIQANRSDWLLIRKVYGKNGGSFAKNMLVWRVWKIAKKLRAEGITENSTDNRKRMLEICA